MKSRFAVNVIPIIAIVRCCNNPASILGVRLKHSWSECFVTDGKINVATEVCFKLDCEAWMKTFDWKRREILEGMIP